MQSTFSKLNYRYFLIGVMCIFIGYLLMIGGGSNEPNVFNYAIFGFQRITLAPILCLTGFIFVLIGILKKNTDKATS